jgi:integrase
MIEGTRGKRLHCHRQVVAADFWKAFVMVGYYTGLRLGDLMLLRFDQIEPTGWLGLIQHKTGYQIRGYLPPDAIEAIGAISEPKRARVFGDLMSKKCVQENYAKLVKRAGLKGSIKTLRKTAATLAECEQPGAASWLLGHRDANIARRHYIDPSQVMQQKPLIPQLELRQGA